MAKTKYQQLLDEISTLSERAITLGREGREAAARLQAVDGQRVIALNERDQARREKDALQRELNDARRELERARLALVAQLLGSR